MGMEYIKNIMIKKDGVYMNTKSNNDSMPYRTYRFDKLTQIYNEYGQIGLDMAIIEMCYDYVLLKGNNKNVTKYMDAMNEARIQGIEKAKMDKVNQLWDDLNMDNEDRRYLYTTKRSDNANNYFKREKEIEQEFYKQVALLVDHTDHKKAGHKEYVEFLEDKCFGYRLDFKKGEICEIIDNTITSKQGGVLDVKKRRDVNFLRIVYK